ncbi:MAG: hypothetical protein JWN51_2973 [Phycisphaerales bacterium]|nr:hypothetical protein [Phycisphaerales bacterium]
MDYKDWLRKDAFMLMPLNHDWVEVRRTLENAAQLPNSDHDAARSQTQEEPLILVGWTFIPHTPLGNRIRAWALGVR